MKMPPPPVVTPSLFLAMAPLITIAASDDNRGERKLGKEVLLLGLECNLTSSFASDYVVL